MGPDSDERRPVPGYDEVLPELDAIVPDWPTLAQQLTDVLRDCVAFVRTNRRDTAWEETCQHLLTAVHAGSAAAAMLASRVGSHVAEPSPHATAEEAIWGSGEHPMRRLAHAYEAAFQAVGVVCLLISQSSTLPSAVRSADFVELAHSAAQSLVRAVGLVFGLRHLGSVVHWCEHVGTLEDRADVLFREAITARLAIAAEAPTSETWTPRLAADLHLLSALEALTDRCEAIADALLLVTFVV